MSNEEKTALEVEREAMEAAAKEENSKRSGVGTRVKVGSTRGRSVVNIKYEFFDESQPDTLPKTVEQFMSVTGVKSNSDLVERLIIGHNDKLYTDASDPIAEYVNAAWSDDVKLQFRTVVRNLAKMQEISIPDAVALVKPGTEKKFLASQSK